MISGPGRRWRRWERWARRAAPLDCRQVGDALQAWLDDETGTRTTAKLAEHLRDCRACGLEAEAYRQLRRAVRRAAEALDPDALSRLGQFSEELARTG